MSKKRIGKHISIAYRFAMIFFKKRMAELGLHQSHHSVLFTLYKSEGLSQEKLSKKLSVDKATITRSIKKLVEDGFVERRQDEKDKRSYLLYVTDKGKEIKPDIDSIFREWNEIALEGFSDEETAQVMSYMERISENLLKHHDANELKYYCQDKEVNKYESK